MMVKTYNIPVPGMRPTTGFFTQLLFYKSASHTDDTLEP